MNETEIRSRIEEIASTARSREDLKDRIVKLCNLPRRNVLVEYHEHGSHVVVEETADRRKVQVIYYHPERRRNSDRRRKARES